MATALQQQLAAIAANSTHQLDLKAQKTRHSQSLVFEPREAATQSFDTIFNICVESFDELCQLDARFASFGGNIFAESSKDVDRTQMNKRENEELDGVIASFLGLVQGRLLLRPAIVSVEWLVRRFRVHEYSTELLLLAFLPYHATDVFNTVMSILPEQLPPSFRWLAPYRASLQVPPRSAIVSAISTNNGFFAAFNTSVLRLATAKHHSAILLGFWASLTAQAVNAMIDSTQSGRDTIRKQREEDLLLRVLPILQGTLSITDIPELYLGTCMIIAVLVTKARLEGRVLDALMQAVASAWTDQTVDDGLACLAVIAEEKEDIGLGSPVVRVVLQSDDVVDRIISLGQRQRTERLVAGLALGALRFAFKTNDITKIEIWQTLLESGLLSQSLIAMVLGHGVQKLRAGTSNRGEHNIGQAVRSAISQFANHPQRVELLRSATKGLGFNLDDLRISQLSSLEDITADVEMPDADLPTSAVAHVGGTAIVDQLLSELESLPTGMTSFLDPDLPYTTYAQHLKVLETSAASDYDFERFSKSVNPTSSEGKGGKALLSFLARSSCGTASPAAKVRALRALHSRLGDVDTQHFLPYAFIALGDISAKVRKAAAELITIMSGNTRKGKSSSAFMISAADAIYGSRTSEQQRLPVEHMHKFLAESIVPVLENCILDPAFFAGSLADILHDGIAGAKEGHASRTKELNKSLRSELCTYFAAHASATPALCARLQLLGVLGHVGKPASHARKEVLIPLVKRVAGNAVADIKRECDNEGVKLKDMEKSLLGNLSYRSNDELHVLRDLASGSLQSWDSLQACAFERLRHLFPLMTTAQLDVADFLLNLALNDASKGQTQGLALETLRSLPLPGEVVELMIEGLPKIADLPDQPPSAKKRRHSHNEATQDGRPNQERIQSAVRRVTLVLELVEAARPEKHPQLIRRLFHLLSELHHYKTLTGSELVYLHQMLLGSLLSIVDGLIKRQSPSAEIAATDIRTDLIVECVRTTTSVQVHNVALLLVSSLATWMPELVLHSVMPLFTFMSSTVLRETDEYSARVADETVTKIVPPLAASLKRKGRDVVTGAAELLLSFVAAFEHIPLHRRLGLFELLVKTLGEGDVLFAVLAMLTERYGAEKSTVSFAIELMGQFDATVAMKALSQYLKLVADTLKPKRHLSDILLGYNEKSTEEALESTSDLLDGLAELLKSTALRTKVAAHLSSGGPSDSTVIRSLYASLLDDAMQLNKTTVTTGDLDEPTADVLRSVLGLLPTADFIQTSGQLMQTGSDATRQQVFRSLEQRAHGARRRSDLTSQKTFIQVLPNCAVYISASQPIATRHAAIACIDQISEKFGKTDRSEVLSAAERVSGTAALQSSEKDLQIISLLALASMIDVLGDEAIGILPGILKTTITYLQTALELPGGSDQQMVDAGFTLVNSVLGTLPWILTGPNLDASLKLADQTLLGGESDLKDSPAQAFCALAARKVAPAELFAALQRTWQDVVPLGYAAANRHLRTFQDAANLHTKTTITRNAQAVLAVLLQAFDLRRSLISQDAELGYQDEVAIVSAIAMDVAAKLNDSAFRPFFARLVDWAYKELPKNDPVGRTQRLISLFDFSTAFFDRLQSHVTSYAAYLLDSAVDILQRPASAAPGDRMLSGLVLSALSSSFRHDQVDFWQAPAHFDAIARPLISQLHLVETMPRDEKLETTIADLAAAASSPEHMKAISGLLIAHMKHASASVRLAAIRAERNVTDRIGLDWMTLLPEMMPVISELLEDDSEEVEREVLKWMKEIEELTGESMNAMLA